MSRLSMKDGRIVLDDQSEKPKSTTQKTSANDSRLSMVDGRIVLADRAPVNTAKNQSYLQRTQKAQQEYLAMDDYTPQRRSSNVMEMAINSLRNRLANSTAGNATREWASRMSNTYQTIANETPVERARRQQARIDRAALIDQIPDNVSEARRQQWAIDNAQLIDQASSMYEGPTRTERVRGRNYDTTVADMFSNDWEPGAMQEYDYLRTVRNERYNPLSREDRDALISRYADAANGNIDAANYQQLLYDVTKNGGIEQLLIEQQADASKDWRYRAALNGNDVSDMTALQRLGAAWGNFGAGVGEQIAGSAVGAAAAAEFTGAQAGQTYWVNQGKKDAEELVRLYKSPDKSEQMQAYIKQREDALRESASMIGGEDYADRVMAYMQRVASGEEEGNVEAVFTNDDIKLNVGDEEYERNYFLKQSNLDTLLDTSEYLTSEGARRLQRTKDVALLNKISPGLTNTVVGAGATAIESAVDAGIAAALHLAGGPLAYIPFATRAFGGSFTEATSAMRQAGQELGIDALNKAAMYGGASAAIEVATEAMWGIGGFMGQVTGGGALDEVATEKLTEALKGFAKTEAGKEALVKIGNYLMGGLTEGVEEWVGYTLNWLMNTSGIYTGEGRENYDWKEVWDSFSSAALSTFISGGANAIAHPVQQSQIGKQLKNGGLDISLSELADLANSEGMENTSLAKAYSDVFSGMPRNIESISDLEAGKLYTAYEEMLGKRSDAINRIEQMQAKVEAGEELTRADVNRITNNSDAVAILAESGAVSEDAFSGGINERRAAVEMALRAFANDTESANQAQAENVQAATENASTPILQRQMDYNAMMAAARGIRQNTAAEDVRNSLRTEQSLRENVISSARSVYNAAERLGASDQAQDVMAQMYSPGQNTIDYAGKMTSIYNRAKSGDSLDVSNLDGITMQQAQAVHNVGRMEYLQEEAKNGEESGLRVRNGLQGNDSQSAGGQTEGVEGTSGSVELRESTAGFERRRPVSGVYSQPVSAASLGIRGGSNRANIRVLTESNDRNVQRAKQIVEERGYKAVLFTGGALEINGQQARGYYDPETNTMYIRADHRLFTADQIARHEAMHDRIRKQEVDLAAVRDDMIKRMGGVKNFERTMRDYYALYEGTGESDASVFEEAVCDAAGNMNEFLYHGHWNDANAAVPFYKTAKESAKATEKDSEKAPTINSGETKFSMEIAPGGIKYVDVNIDQTMFDGLSVKEMQDLAYRIIRDRFKGKVIGTDYTAYVDRAGARHYAYPANRRMPDSQKAMKMKASPELDNIISASTYRENEADDGRHPEATGGFDKLDTILKVGDRVYSAEISVMVTDRGRRFYDLTKFKDITDGETGQTILGTAAETASNVSDNTVAEENESVKEIIDELGDSGEYNSEAGGSFSREIDPDKLRELNSGKTMTVYRSMQLINGKLYPPMAAKIDDGSGKRKLVEPTAFDEWYRADEHPELIDKNGKFKLDKAKGTPLNVAYNPYWHTSDMMLNDQFSGAYDRPNLVTVECEIPESELTSGYKAQYAKDAVGLTPWHSGPVATQLGNAGNPRNVYLSRWVKVKRIVPDSEVAKSVAKTLKGTGITVPANTVTPSLRSELEKIGVPISETYGLNDKTAERLNATLKNVEVLHKGKHSRDLDSYLMEHHKEYENDETNRKIAAEGVQDLINGAARISAAGGEVDMAKQRRDIRTLGNGISAQFVKTGRVNLNGTRIRSAEDLAQVGQIFRNPKFETLRYLYVKKGKIVGTDSVTAMLPGISPAFSKDFQEADLIKKIARTGADGVYLLHNHPSGDVTPSRQDFGVTGKLAETIQNNTKAKFMGHVVIDHETYAQIDVDTNKRTASWEQKTIPGQSSFDFLLAPSLDNENLGKEVLNAGAVAAVGKEVVNSSGYSAIIYASSKGYVRQLQEVSDKALKNNKQIGNYIRNQRVNSGAGMAFVYTKDRDVYDALVQVYGDDILTDVVLDGAEFKDMRKNVFQREGMYMGVKEGEIGGVHANEETAKFSRDLDAESNFNALYTTLEDGRIKPNNVEDLSTEDWKLIYKAVNKLGYGLESAKQAKEVYSRYVGQGGFNKEQSEAIKKAYGVVEDGGVAANPKREALARKTFGTTGDFREAGYLMRNGSMLDFSGKKDGGPAHVRYMDHREIGSVFGENEIPEDKRRYGDNSAYMNAFISEGNIRLMDGQGVTIGEMEPTAQQYTMLRQFIDRVMRNEDYFYLDLSNNDGYTVASRDYEGRDGSAKVIRDIKEYFKNGELPYRSNLSAFFSRDLSNGELYEANRQLQKDLTELRSKLKTRTEQRNYWRGQTKVTEGRKLRIDDVTKLAREIIKGQDSSADAKTVAEKMKSLGEYLLNSQDENVYDEARLKAYEIAHDILANAKMLNTKGGDDFYSDFRTALKNQMIYVAPSVREEVAPDGWNDFRKAQFGTVNMTADQNKGKTVDTVYHDLQATFGEWLLPEYIVSEADQLNKILEVIETYRPVYENLNSYEMADAVEWTANEILTRIIGEEIRETNPTYADRMEKKLAGQKAKAQTALKQVRQQRDRKVADLKAHYQQVAEDRRNRKIDSEMRTRLLHIAKRLNNKKLTRATRSLLDQYIGELDLVSKGILGRTVKELESLQAWYDSYKESMGEDFIPDKFIERKIARLSKRHISDLTQEEVADLTTVLLNIETMIRTQNELIESKIKMDAYAAGVQTIDDINNSNGKTGFLNKFISTETATPEREIHRITGYRENSPLYQAAKELSDGQRKMLDYQMRAEALFKKWTTDKKFIQSIAGKKAEAIIVKGYVDGAMQDVVITPAMRMALYLHSKNDDNMRHIAKGGVKIPNMSLYAKGKIQEAYDKADRVVFTRGMINEIAAHMSDKERAFADAVDRYYNGMSRNEINDTSEALRGYAIAGVDHYYPIDTDGSFLKKEFDAIKRDGSIEGMGILKERIEGATNPIMLYDMNDTLNRSISQHSKYVGLAIPVRNFNKLYSVTTFNYETSVAETLKKNWGSDATKYVEKMMADLQNGTGLASDSWGDLLARARSHYAGAVLTTNASVALKQTASYPTAAAVVGYGPLLKALKDNNRKADLDLIAKYTPLLWYRSKGFSTTELGDIGKEGGHIPKVLNWIQGMDVWTTRKLWLAAEYYVESNNRALARGTDAYYKEVGNVYNRIIEETQPNYTMMQRPQILRSDNALTRALNMFKTQPFQNFNILYDAFGNLAAKSREYKANATQENLQALKSARTNVARAVSSQVVSAFVFALMQFAWDSFRGKAKKYKDDDEEMTFASWLKGMGINVLSSVGGMIPFGSYALELGEAMTDAILKGFKLDPFFDQTFYGLSENAADSMNDMGNAILNTITQTSKALQGESTTETTVRSLVDSAANIAQFAGVPVNNVLKLAQSIARNVFLATDGKYIGGFEALRVTTDPSKYKSDYYNLLRKAWENDQTAFNEIRKRMIDLPGDPFATSSKTAEENIDAKVKEWRKETASQDSFYGTIYDGLTGSALWDEADPDQQNKALSQLLSLALEMGVEGSDKAGAKSKAAIDGGASVGLDATEYMLYQLALSMTNSDGGTAKNSEYEEAIRMVPGLSNAERSYLWSTTHTSDKNNPWK